MTGYLLIGREYKSEYEYTSKQRDQLATIQTNIIKPCIIVSPFQLIPPIFTRQIISVVFVLRSTALASSASPTAYFYAMTSTSRTSTADCEVIILHLVFRVVHDWISPHWTQQKQTNKQNTPDT